MEITFSDNSILEVRNINFTEDANNLIIVLSNDFTKVKEIFKNAEKISTISTDNAEYCGYTILKSISDFYDGTDDTEEIRVELEYNGLSKQIDDLKTENKSAQNTINMLIDCIMELSTIVYRTSDSTENMEAK